jgi:L-2-hydroxyglutarate oxidase LhgO
VDAVNVLLIGLDPTVVDYDRWPGLTAEKLEAGLRRDETTLNESGYAARICFIDHGETAEEVVKATLAETDFACVLVGAGVRTDNEEFLLFEKLINVVHEHAPGARICFNTGPADSVEAVQRWI